MQAKDFSNVVSMADRGMPQAVEVEEEILGALLLDPHAFARVSELKPEHFYYSNNCRIFEAIQRVDAQEQPIDLMTVAEELLKSGELEQVGGQGRLADLVEFIPSAVNIDHHAGIVIDRAKRRALIDLSNELGRQARDLATPLLTIQQDAETRIFALSEASSARGAIDLASYLHEEMEHVLTRHQEQQEGITGSDATRTGFYDIDAMTNGGFREGELIILAGRPSMGKTALALAIAKQFAEANHPALFFSMEMSGKQLARRLWSNATQIEAGRIGSGRIATQEWEVLGHKLAVLANLPFYVDEEPDPSVSYITSVATALRGKNGPLGGIFIDYLQLMQGDGDNRVQELSKITRALKKMARKLGCPVIALSQLSRSVENRSNKRPLMSDLRESGSIEQDADLVLLLYRDEYYNSDTPERGVAEVNFAKHRNGPTGVVRLLFDSRYTDFKNLAPRINQ